MVTTVDSFEPDVIVVGAGTAGLPATIAAAESGARVLLIEKADRIGGTLYLTGGNISAGGTRRQRERGIDDSPQEHFDDLVRMSRGGLNRELTRLACDQAPIAADWLDDNGFEFDPITPTITFSHEPYGKPRTYWGVEPGLSLLAVFRRLLEPQIAADQVQVLLGTAVDRLIVEDDRVVGVVAGGREFRAGRVVLTSGGCASNPDLFARLSGGWRPLSIARPDSTGNGIVMAEAVGGAIVNQGVFLPSIGGFVDPGAPTRVYQDNPDRFTHLPILIPQNREPWELWVNTAGDRFIREDEPDIDHRENAVKAQGLTFWVIWDEAILRDAPPIVRQWTPDDVHTEAKSGRLVVSADSLAGLAAKMGVPAATLLAAVGGYNAAMDAGTADPLGREYRPRPIAEGPFYAIRQHGVTLLSWPGLKVDTGLAVLRDDDTPIAGLYAVGEILGVSQFMGTAFCGGMSVGPAIALGRYLGLRLGAAAAVHA